MLFRSLLTSLSRKYGISTPEGKASVARDFFSYVDSLRSEIEKTTNLERLGEVLGVSLDSIKKDFENRLRASQSAPVRRPAATDGG